MKVKSKLLLDFQAASVSTAVAGGISWWGLSGNANKIKQMSKDTIPAILNLYRIRTKIRNLHLSMKDMLDQSISVDAVKKDPDDIEKEKNIFYGGIYV